MISICINYQLHGYCRRIASHTRRSNWSRHVLKWLYFQYLTTYNIAIDNKWQEQKNLSLILFWFWYSLIATQQASCVADNTILRETFKAISFIFRFSRKECLSMSLSVDKWCHLWSIQIIKNGSRFYFRSMKTTTNWSTITFSSDIMQIYLTRFIFNITCIRIQRWEKPPDLLFSNGTIEHGSFSLTWNQEYWSKITESLVRCFIAVVKWFCIWSIQFFEVVKIFLFHFVISLWSMWNWCHNSSS